MENTTKETTELKTKAEAKAEAWAQLRVAIELKANAELNLKIENIEREIQPALYEQSMDRALIKNKTQEGSNLNTL